MPFVSILAHANTTKCADWLGDSWAALPDIALLYCEEEKLHSCRKIELGCIIFSLEKQRAGDVEVGNEARKISRENKHASS